MPGPKPKQLRFASERGEFSAPESRREALTKAGARVLDKPASDGNGDPLPFKPKTSVAAQAAKKAPDSPEPERRKFGQKATTDTEEKV